MTGKKKEDESPDKKSKSNKGFFNMDDIMNSVIPIMGMMIVLPTILSRSSIAQDTNAMAQQMSLQVYQGINDPRWVDANSNLKYIDLINEKPYQPWMMAYIVNHGPYPVDIALNYPAESFTVGIGETRTINRSGARERINVLFFICGAGQTARISVTGEY